VALNSADPPEAARPSSQDLVPRSHCRTSDSLYVAYVWSSRRRTPNPQGLLRPTAGSVESQTPKELKWFIGFGVQVVAVDVRPLVPGDTRPIWPSRCRGDSVTTTTRCSRSTVGKPNLRSSGSIGAERAAVPVSLPFVGRPHRNGPARIFGSNIFLDKTNLEQKLQTTEALLQQVRMHQSLEGATPDGSRGGPTGEPANFEHYELAKSLPRLIRSCRSRLNTNSPPTGAVGIQTGNQRGRCDGLEPARD